MDNTITGYQWGDDLSYIGPYTFPTSNDKEDIHLPPRTTLHPPPSDIPAGYEAAWDAAGDQWVVRAEDLSWVATGSEA